MGDQHDTGMFLPLRPVEFHVLLSLSRGERHGYGIVQEAEALGEKLDLSTVYRALSRMAEEGLITAAADPRLAAGGGERRNCYAITARGREVGEAEAKRLSVLTRAARLRGLLDCARWSCW